MLKSTYHFDITTLPFWYSPLSILTSDTYHFDNEILPFWYIIINNKETQKKLKKNIIRNIIALKNIFLMSKKLFFGNKITKCLFCLFL